jgi:ElaB/YqjD/DUF883 family membrane-anchored ribosome-binding protein
MAPDSSVNAGKEQLLQDFNRVVSDTEALLRSLANVTGANVAELRASAQENLRATKERLRRLQDAAAESTTAAARATDEYVHDNPWVAIGIAAGVGLIVGLAISGRR